MVALLFDIFAQVRCSRTNVRVERLISLILLIAIAYTSSTFKGQKIKS